MKTELRDILWHNSSSHHTQIWFMNGHKISSRANVLDENNMAIQVGPPWRIVGASDMNGNGKSDVVWYNDTSHHTQIWFMNGDRIVSRANVVDENNTAIQVGPPWSIVGVGDMNGNGRSDIVWHNDTSHHTQIWFMSDHKIVSRANVVDENDTAIQVGPPWRIVGVGDMNSNGKSDIVWHNDTSHHTQIWFMNDNKIVSRANVVDENGTAIQVDLPWSIVGVGDMNGNGISDIVWHNSSSNHTQIWFMNGHRIANRLNAVDENGTAIQVGPPWSIVGVGEFNPINTPDLGPVGSAGTMPPFNPGSTVQLPDTVTLDSGSITTDLSIGGFARLVISRTGDFTFTGHMHNSGALGIDFLLTFVVMTPSGIAYTVQRSGHTAGTFTSGSRDDDWTISGLNPGIRDNWAQASQARLTWTMHANDTLTPHIGKALEDTLQEALKAVGQVAVKAVIALL